MMRTHIEFRTGKFPPYADEGVQVNPGLYGKRLAEYLKMHLAEQGVGCGDIYAEDWGWAIPIKNDAFELWVGCGNYEEYPDGFLCFIEPSKPTIRRLLKKIDTTQAVARVADALERILHADPQIRDVRWWSEQETGT